MKKKIVEIAHDLLHEVAEESDRLVDFTCGQGFDTYAMAQWVSKGEVIAFDIQEKAINETRARCQDMPWVRVICKSHELVDEEIGRFKAGIFNCGYLPHGDKRITTHSEGVIAALKKALPLLQQNGRLVLVMYPGFEAGKQESLDVEEYVMNLPARDFDVLKIQLLNRNCAPYILMIDRK